MNSKKCILIYYAVVIVFIGLPIWYKTTSPIRYNLPDVKSLMVHLQMTVNRVQINVIDVERDSETLNYEMMKNDFTNNWSRYDSQSRGLIYEFQWVVRGMKDEIEDRLFNSSDLKRTDELSKELKVRYKQGNLSIYLLSDQDWMRLIGDKFKNVIYGSYRSFYARRSEATCSYLAEQVFKILENQLDEDVLNAYSKVELVEAKIPKNVESSLLNLKLTIYLNIMTEELNDSIAFQQSDYFKTITKMRSKFLSEFTGTNFNLNLMSQMINNALPEDLLQNNLVGLKDDRLFDLKAVPELLNKIETRISPPSDKHTLEFNIIVPSSNKPKLYFYDRSTEQISNAIVTPYQPNTLIWNDSNDFNIAFKSFIRKQLGLPFKQSKSSLRRDIFFGKWEFDNLIRQITNKQLSKTLESLESLEKLLNKISNIVIEEKISKRMFDAIEYAHRAIDELENYGLSKAFEYSSKAFSNSETAYYDPSLLSLLYFPEEQKYAIYVPLFFPIAIQLLAYPIGYFKRLLRARRHKKTD